MQPEQEAATRLAGGSAVAIDTQEAVEEMQKKGKQKEVDAVRQRPSSARKAAKRPLPREALWDSDLEEDMEESESEGDESESSKSSEEEEEGEASYKPALGKKGTIRSPAKRLRAGAGGRAGGGSSTGTWSKISLLTDEERNSCFWLRRKGHAALADRDKAKKNIPEAIRNKNEMASCHDCQGYHIRHNCTSGTCMKSYCQACCRHYEYLFQSQQGEMLHDLKEIFCKGNCPCCLNICVRKKCLRERPKTKLPPSAPALDPEERRLMALHMATSLKDHAEKLVSLAEKEAARQGTSITAAPQVPRAELDECEC